VLSEYPAKRRLSREAFFIGDSRFDYSVCDDVQYDQLQDDSLSFDIRDEIASDVLWKHYGTDNVWEIMTKQSLVLFIHVNDLHNGGVLLSEKDRMISNALLQKLVEEH